MTSPRRLHLLRHAKSSWDDRSLRDHARPLAPRGESAAEAVRRHLAAERVAVDLVLCSTATRTRQTWQAVAGGVAGDPEVRYLDDIYEADPDDLLALLRRSGGEAGAVLLVGHNPGIGELAAGLTGAPESSLARRVHEKYPTAALASFTLPGEWPALGYGGAQLTGFVRPRDLPPV